MGAALPETNFEVSVVENADGEQFERAVNSFVTKPRRGDLAMFYYPGNATLVEGQTEQRRLLRICRAALKDEILSVFVFSVGTWEN
jgi:hypothetical protein